MCGVWDAMKKHESEKPPPGAGPEAVSPAEPAAEEARPSPVARALAKAQAQAADLAVAAPVAAAGPAEESVATLDAPVTATLAPPNTSPKPPAAAGGVNEYSPLLIAHHDRGGPIAEEYRSLRTNLLAQCSDQRFCYIVTSADIGEGKTITCANLAVIMAERQDRKTILVDFDLRRRRLAGLFRMPLTLGVADVIRGSARLEDVVHGTVYPNLFVLPSGEVRADEVGELVTRPEMDEMIADLRRRYDYILIDTPPMNVVAETGMIGKSVGEALLVVRMNKTRRESVEKAVRLLHAANVKMAGIVLTHRTYHIPEYVYRYA